MTERPILFSAPMVRAIRDDSKTQTRRLVKPQPPRVMPPPQRHEFSIGGHDYRCPYGQPGDVKPTRFRDAAPPANGWYWVRWADADQERLVWLVRVPDEPQDNPPETETHRWVWSKSPEDDPESLVLDIADPMSIEWRRPGDMLWVRETWDWRDWSWNKDCRVRIAYAADGEQADKTSPVGWRPTIYNYERWRPSIHMPRWASRITLEVTGVRVERLHDISEEDARAEGVNEFPIRFQDQRGRIRQATYHRMAESNKEAFQRLWRSVYGGDSWDANPWVWVVEFRRLP
jgi:hypothetical protein